MKKNTMNKYKQDKNTSVLCTADLDPRPIAGNLLTGEFLCYAAIIRLPWKFHGHADSSNRFSLIRIR